MPFDLAEWPPQKAARSRRGMVSHLQGAAAEDRVLDHYQGRGATLRARRWRGAAGEIDLIFAEAGILVFVEVKSARDQAHALAALSPSQTGRICRAVEEYVADEPDGQLTEVRFDLALVCGTAPVEILPNVLAA